MSEILLNDILKIPENQIQDYKVKFNVNNGYTEPLLVMTRSYDEICNWIAWKKEKDDLPRPKVIGFVRYYTVSQEQWIFAGAYEVNKKSNFNEIKEGVGYDLTPIPEYQNLYGRLVVEYKNTTQQLKRNAENVLNDIKVVELLKKPYNGEEYEGYNNMFVPLFEDKLETQCCLNDFEVLEKYELPCWDFHDISQIEEFKQALKLSNFDFNKLCMKPKKGTGAQGFRILDYPYDVWKIRDILQRSGQEFILMPYLEDEELSIDFLRKDNKTLFVPRRKNRKNRIQEIVFDDEIKEICNDIEKSGLPDVMEVVGNIQFMKHNEKYYLLEINCRMSGGIHLDNLAGVNFPYLLIKKILEEEFELPEVKECKVCNVERGVIV